MAEDKEEFLARWSRLKKEQRAAESAAAPAKPDESAPNGTMPASTAQAPVQDEAPPLPPVEKLTPESDFAPFMHPKVPELMRRAALKQLFRDPRYNVVDKFEAYSDDYTVVATTTPEMVEKANRLRDRLEQEMQARSGKAAEKTSAEPPAAETQQANAPEPEPKKKDGAGTQDT
jgi:hypothetical protein